MASPSFSRDRYGRGTGVARVGLREVMPHAAMLQAVDLRDFDAIEVAHHRFLPGESETLPLEGHMVSLNLSGPHHLVQKRNGRTHGGLDLPGDVDVVPAGTPEYWRLEASAEDVSMLLDDGFVRRVAEEVDLDPDGFEIVPSFTTPDPQVERVGLSLLSEMGTEGLAGEFFAESQANILALHLVRHYSSLGSRSRRKAEREAGKGSSRRSLERAVEYINDNLSRKLSLAEIAGAAHMSPHHFARSFKAAYGLSPHQYVIQRRVERAKSLLAGTDLSVVDVAGAVGFANQSHLSHHVKRLLGVSPLALRRSARR